MAVVGFARRSRLARSFAVNAAEEALEDRSQRRQATSNDADVEFHGRPNGEVARIPQPVAELAIVDDIGQPDNSSCAGEDTETKDTNERDPSAEMDVEVPEHWYGNNNGKEEIGEDVA